MICSVFIHGLPVQQGSKVLRKIRGGPRKGESVMVESKAKPLKAWRDDVAKSVLAEVRRHREWPSTKEENRHVPFKATVVFVMPRAPSHLSKKCPIPHLLYRIPTPKAPKRATVKPDMDKLVRAVCDAVTKIAWRDDCQMVALEAYKLYGQGVQGAWIKLESIDPMAFPPHLLGELQREGLSVVGVDVVGRK